MHPSGFPFLLVWCLRLAALLAQAPKPPVVMSPEIAGDRTVAFRIYAPKAGPLEPNAYFYTFNVDGARTIDPANTNTIVASGRFPQSALEVRGESPLLSESQQVPKGTAPAEFLDSVPQGRDRSYYV